MNFHCLFEQSGTFKNVLIQNGHKAYDYDILNDYGETDCQKDLFSEIEKEFDNLINYSQNKTIFSNMTQENDFIIAFFPCTYFSSYNNMIFRMENSQVKCWKEEWNAKIITSVIDRNLERARYFEIYLKFCYICKIRKLRCIIENPASGGNTNFLILHSPARIGFFEKDRSLWGDLLKKPTNYFVINFEMKEEFIMFSPTIRSCGIELLKGKQRSEISSIYAENFYKRFLAYKV